MPMSRFAAVIFVIGFVAAELLFTPYEAYLEGVLAVAIVAAAAVGSLMHPRKEVFHVRTSARLFDRDGNHSLEHDFLAVRVELARLWLWVLPTVIAVATLAFSAASGLTKFSFLNWIFSSGHAYLALWFCENSPFLVLLVLWAWIDERRVMRDAEACSTTRVSISRPRAGYVGRVAYQFRGERGEYYGGDCAYFAFAHPRELASIVFYNVRKWELNKIAMGFIFHRFVVFGRGLTDLDEQTTAAQDLLVETTPLASTRSESHARVVA